MNPTVSDNKNPFCPGGSICLTDELGVGSCWIHRAKEVFEDIHKAYAPIYSISDNLTAEEVAAMIMPSVNVSAVNIINTGSEMCLTTYDNYVYYMPKE